MPFIAGLLCNCVEKFDVVLPPPAQSLQVCQLSVLSS
jgi:hypothetical protein